MDEKCVKLQNPAHFWAKTHRVYRYKLSCTGTGIQWVTCIGTGQRCTGTGCAVGNLYRYKSKLYWYRLFQQPHFLLILHR